jgi:sulfite dehydrogenase (cytochrome) subunit B
VTQIRHRIILTIFLLGLTATLTYGVTLAQGPAAPGRHRAIQLTSQKVSLPFGNQVFAGGDAAKLANSRCLLCHSKDMIDAQPPLTLETWKNEIDKMRTAYDCPLRADQAAGVAEFISHPASASAAGGD